MSRVAKHWAVGSRSLMSCVLLSTGYTGLTRAALRRLKSETNLISSFFCLGEPSASPTSLPLSCLFLPPSAPPSPPSESELIVFGDPERLLDPDLPDLAGDAEPEDRLPDLLRDFPLADPDLAEDSDLDLDLLESEPESVVLCCEMNFSILLRTIVLILSV